MGMAGGRRKRRSENRLHSQPGQPHLARPLSHLRQRCLGARLLSQIQQPASRIPASVVERSQLGRNQQTLPSVSKEVGGVVPGLRPVQSLAWGRTHSSAPFFFFSTSRTRQLRIHHFEPANRNSTVAQFLCN